MSKINYNLNLIKGIVFDIDGVLSPSTIPLDENGMPRRMVNVKDGYAIQLAVKHGYKISVITGANDSRIEARYRGLGINDVYTNTSIKLPVLKNWAEKSNLKPEEIIYVGDDIPDFECIKYAGLGVCPQDAATDIKSIADYISPVCGGYGVARDILEELMKCQDNWLNNEKAFGW